MWVLGVVGDCDIQALRLDDLVVPSGLKLYDSNAWFDSFKLGFSNGSNRCSSAIESQWELI